MSASRGDDIAAQVAEAEAYLDKHRVIPVLNHLTTLLLIERPPDPKAFLVTKLTEIRNAKKRGQSVSLFHADHVAALFHLFDVTGKGTLQPSQVRQALLALGITPDQADKALAHNNGAIDTRIFVQIA